jgi:hypothetical protein
MNWTINPAKLDEARDFLDIQYPVRVRQITPSKILPGKVGKYDGLGYWGPTTTTRLDEPHHHISMDGTLSAFMANQVLWHELTHAAQAEDFLDNARDGEEPYRAANRELRQAFGREMRTIRGERGLSKTAGMTRDYSDVSFEVEAGDVMKNSKKIEIIEPVFTESSVFDNPLTDAQGRYRWRVDMWDNSGKKFIGTVYVLAADEYGAKKWARDNHMKHEGWSNRVYAYKTPPREEDQNGTA